MIVLKHLNNEKKGYELSWKNEPVTESVEKTINLRLVIPTKGFIDVTVNVHAVVA